MRSRTKAVQWGFLALSLVAGGLAMDDADAKMRRAVAHTQLAPPGSSAMRRARGEVVAKADENGREIVIVRLHGLRPGSYTLLCDDPSTPERVPVAFAKVRAGREHRASLRLDSARGDLMPNGASVDLLAGVRMEVRDEAGFLVLWGGMPDPHGVKAAQAPDGFAFVEEVVQLDDFDADTAGAAPANWDVSGPEITVDAAIHDGDAGNSVKIEDLDAVAGAPEMGRTFPAQEHFFAVEFTLTSPATPGRVVFRLGQGAAPTTFATGFGDGLGFYEDGTIGFGVGDTIQPSAASTAYRIRVDVDLDTDLFDVAIDGTAVVTDRALGFAGTALDRIVFSTGATTTGTANVDSVAVINKVLDAKPVANAGPDQVVEATGPTTEVTLDGSGSTDAEDAELTYTWTGAFDEATATGVNPTVHFTGLGTFEVTLVVNDGVSDSDPDTVQIVLQDTTPPELTVTGLPTSLWPPNHKLVTLHPTVTATDAVDQDVDVTLEVTSNESDNGTGDGNTSGDIAIRSPSDFDLRAERAGPGSGRTYHLVWTATDDSGNQTTVTQDLVIPHDQGQGGGGPHGNAKGRRRSR